MFKKLLIFIPVALIFGAVQIQAVTAMLSGSTAVKETSVSRDLLAKQEMSLSKRYANPTVNDVFKDNILLTLAYLSGKVQNSHQISWDALHKPTTYELVLQPGEVFAFHNDVLPQYVGKKITSTNAHFNGAEGFRSDGYLYGDGVCHFA